MAQQTKHKQTFMESLATFIVDKRNLFFLLTVIALIFSAFSRNWVEVENDLTAFLPDDAETKQALNVMAAEFTTYGTAEVMDSITYDAAEVLRDNIADVKGVQSVDFDETTDHYSNAAALYTVTFDYDEADDACLTALDAVKDTLSGYDLYISTDLGNTLQDTIASEVSVIMVDVAIIVGGLAAMLFMQFKIGPDMGICLIKAILYALLSVFVVMPGLLVLFGPLIEKTKHKNFVPRVDFIGRYDFRTRRIVPVIFAVFVVFGLFLSNKCPYAYGYSDLTTPKLNETQIAENKIKDTFTSKNMVALVVPSGDYEREAQMLRELEGYDEIDYTMGRANVEAMDGGYMLADKLTPRQFSELADVDYEIAQLLYAAYATQQGDYGKLAGNIDSYKVPLMDIFLYVCDQVDAGIVTMDEEQTQTLNDARGQIESAKAQLEGEDYSRMLLYLTLPVGGDTTYAFTDTIRDIARSYYPDGNVYVAGDSTNEYDFQKSFSRDNAVVSIVSLLIVLVVLLFTFKSVGMPLLLIMVIQGSIWINFSIPSLTGTPLFFMSYLVVSSIQMGANIDYAIVIASRYEELKDKMDHQQAIIETLNFAFPTVLTSGTILTVAGTLIGQITSEATIAGIGQSLGRGTIISMLLVLFVLPQILLIGSGIVDKTSFAVPKVIRKRETSGRMFVDGVVTGEINGTVSGIMRASVDGDINLNLLSGSVSEQSLPEHSPPMENKPTEAETGKEADTDEEA